MEKKSKKKNFKIQNGEKNEKIAHTIKNRTKQTDIKKCSDRGVQNNNGSKIWTEHLKMIPKKNSKFGK